MQQIPVPASNIDNGTLLSHSKRPEWGLGVCVERDHYRWTIQFEDGKSRKLGMEYLYLLQVVALPLEQQSSILDSLAAAAGVSTARKVASKEGREVVSLNQQLRLFKQRWPEGFQTQGWTKHWRAADRPTKRHRDTAIITARKQLDSDVISRLMASECHAEVITRLCSVLASTTLVTSKQLEPLRNLRFDAQHGVASALLAMLDGSEPFVKAHRCFIAALSKVGNCSWALATAPIALLRPEQYFVVSPNSFRKQARCLAPQLSLTSRPDARIYQDLVYMVQMVQAKLVAAGLAPRDMFDVVDFMWSTLRPSAVAAIAALPPVQSTPGASRIVSFIGFVQSASHPEATIQAENSELVQAA